jgi:hypothetical protein
VVLSTIEHAEETGSVDELYRAKDAVDRMDAIVRDTLTLARQGQAIDETIASAHGWAVWATDQGDGGARIVFDGVEFAESAQPMAPLAPE